MTDPFEEFEFKPITEGLGFHNKNKAVADSAPAGDPLDEIFEKRASLEMLSESPGAETVPEITPALPRKPVSNYVSEITPASQKVDEILKTLNERKRYDFSDAQKVSAHADPAKSTYTKTTPGFFAATLDGMLITAAYLSCLIVLLLVTKVDLLTNILNPDDQNMVLIGLGGLFATLTWTYLTANRVFLGFTPGEWVFDQTLGRPEDVGSAEYSLKVSLRSAIVIMTGLVLLPVLSMIFRRDLIGALLGVELLKKA